MQFLFFAIAVLSVGGCEGGAVVMPGDGGSDDPGGGPGKDPIPTKGGAFCLGRLKNKSLSCSASLPPPPLIVFLSVPSGPGGGCGGLGGGSNGPGGGSNGPGSGSSGPGGGSSGPGGCHAQPFSFIGTHIRYRRTIQPACAMLAMPNARGPPEPSEPSGLPTE